MKSVSAIRTPEITRALAVKRVNAVTAILVGGVLVVATLWRFGIDARASALLVGVLGVACGLLYANAFEYLLHRFLLHWGEGFLVQRHALHHNSLGTRDEPRYINFATSPWIVVLVFALNAAPVFAALFLSTRLWTRFTAGIFAAGVFAGFTAYFVLYEEIHWRIHMGGWLPEWMRFARRHHMLHHREAEGYYNVFLPIFDWLVARIEGKRGLAHPR